MFDVKKSLLPYPKKVLMGGDCIKLGTLHAADVCVCLQNNFGDFACEVLQILKKAFLESLR